ncbi:hypothetical protein M758_UG329100 [Ceratodon purpureus]|nr:hypothetical protein M758_UG271700 [Ceratodon purpureus]KAG0597332.1 hypothetical protein M758_UG329100 [Ceratodon purpureus]
MRRKWLKSRCSPPPSSFPITSICMCIMLMPTQELIPSSSSSNSLPSDLMGQHRRDIYYTADYTPKELDMLRRLVRRMEEDAERFCANELTTHETELLVSDSKAVLLSNGLSRTDPSPRRLSCAKDETENTSSSYSIFGKRSGSPL